ncbi:MAG: hypothetical protein ACRD1L_12485 [Terriglobales bacterium]
MNHQLLLISRDPELTERIRQALPPTLALELDCAPAYRPATDPRGWLLVLEDARAGAGVAPAPATAAPVLWIGAAVGDAGPRPHGGIADYLEPALTPAKLAFILHQHLAAAYLHRMRHLGEPSPQPRTAGPTGEGTSDGVGAWEEVQSQLDNLLAGILGNAELAREASRRLQPAVARRLERICGLAGEMRSLLPALRAATPGEARCRMDAAA